MTVIEMVDGCYFVSSNRMLSRQEHVPIANPSLISKCNSFITPLGPISVIKLVVIKLYLGLRIMQSVATTRVNYSELFSDLLPFLKYFSRLERILGDFLAFSVILLGSYRILLEIFTIFFGFPVNLFISN